MERTDGRRAAAGAVRRDQGAGHDPERLIDATAALLDWATSEGLAWDRSDGAEGERWTARLELYRSDPADEPDMNKWETELAFRLAGQ